MNCLGIDTFSSCVEYNGPEISSLGIIPGMSINEVISILAANSIPQSPLSLEAKNIQVNSNYNASGANECLPNVPASRHTIALSGSNSAPTMSYDFSRADLPPGYNIGAVSVRGTKTTTNVNGAVFSSNATIGTIGLTAEDFPLYINAVVQINTPCGPILTSADWGISYPQADTSFTVLLYPTTFSRSPSVEITLEEKLRQLENEIQNIGLRLNN
jgi:hypothetical protein